MELTKEKSEELAMLIEMAKQFLTLIDVEYLKQVAQKTLVQARRQDAMSVLNPSHPLLANDLLYQQGESLRFLAYFIDSLKECDRLKEELKDLKKNQEEINQLFI